MLIIPMELLLRQGIALADHMSFVQQPSGLKFVEEHCRLVWLHPDENAWIPFGHIAIPWHFSPFGDKTVVHNVAIVLPMLSPRLESKLPTKVLEAMQEWLKTVTAAQSSRGWPQRHELVHNVFLK